MDTDRTLVIIPTYQERENVRVIVARVREAVPWAHVLVVDDASPDGTGDLADVMAVLDDHVHVLHRAGKQGLGAAYRAGFAWGLARDFDALVEMDADGSHLPEQLPLLLAALPAADLVIGSRWVPGGRIQNWPVRRRVLSKGGNLYARLALGLAVRDATGGYRVFRRSALEHIDVLSTTSHGYCFQVDLARQVAEAGLRVVEVPITFVEREHGASKMSGAIMRESLVRISVWGLRHRGQQLRSHLGRSDAPEPRPAARVQVR